EKADHGAGHRDHGGQPCGTQTSQESQQTLQRTSPCLCALCQWAKFAHGMVSIRLTTGNSCAKTTTPARFGEPARTNRGLGGGLLPILLDAGGAQPCETM